MRVIDRASQKTLQINFLFGTAAVLLGLFFSSYFFQQQLLSVVMREVEAVARTAEAHYEGGNLIQLRVDLDELSSKFDLMKGVFRDRDGKVIWESREQSSCKAGFFQKNWFALFRVRTDHEGCMSVSGNVRFKNGSKIGTVSFSKSTENEWIGFLYSSTVNALILVLIALGFHLYFNYVLSETLTPLYRLHEEMKTRLQEIGATEVEPAARDQDEVVFIMKGFHKLLRAWDDLKAKEIEVAIAKSKADLAAQIAHDVRSPLAALKALETDLHQLPERSRMMLRSAATRIQDIAHGLLAQNREATSVSGQSDAQRSVVLVSGLLESLISEKRLQYRSHAGLTLETRWGEEGYGIFVDVNPSGFLRVFSNLMNNAVEALSDSGGRIEVALELRQQQVLIRIQDNGRGIPAEILSQVMQKGVTFGKTEGSGLGLSHAQETVKKWGGEIQIQSEPGKGTCVSISLPPAPSPQWFLKSLEIKKNTKVIVMDDDASIAELWKNRMAQILEPVCFSSPGPFTDYVTGLDFDSAESEFLFLVDYEIHGFSQTGLDLIEGLGIASRSILVTSHDSDPKVVQRCERMGVRLIPKSVISWLRIERSL